MYLYLIGAFDYNSTLLAVKVGVTEDVGKRIAAMQTGQFCDMKLILAWETCSRRKCFFVEKELHKHYENKRIRGEWFRHMIVRDFVAVAGSLMGSAPCAIPGVPGCLKEVQCDVARRRERRLRHKESKRLRKASMTQLVQNQ